MVVLLLVNGQALPASHGVQSLASPLEYVP